MERNFENSARNPENLVTGCLVEWRCLKGYEKCFMVEEIKPISGGPLKLAVGAVVKIRRLDEDGNTIPDGESHEVTVSYGMESDLNVFAYVTIFDLPPAVLN
jgi:hypothetical protein